MFGEKKQADKKYFMPKSIKMLFYEFTFNQYSVKYA